MRDFGQVALGSTMLAMYRGEEPPTLRLQLGNSSGSIPLYGPHSPAELLRELAEAAGILAAILEGPAPAELLRELAEAAAILEGPARKRRPPVY